MPDAPPVADAKLPEDLAVCQAMIRELLIALAQSRRSNEQLEHRLDRLLKQLYGPRADTLNPNQLPLFDTPALPEPVPEPVVDAKPATAKKKGHGRKGLPENLRRETVVIDIPEAEKTAFGGVWTKIGEEVSERLDYTPSSVFVKRTVRPKYVVRREAQAEAMRIAELPAEALPKSKAASGLVADVIVSKCVDHLPLYRQEKRYARQGVASRSRVRRCATGWPKPPSR